MGGGLMEAALELAAGLVRTATSGKPFETDRERVEHHVRRALRIPSALIAWEDSMKAGTRRALELLAVQGYRGWHGARPLLEGDRLWSLPESSLGALVGLDRTVLDQGRAANRSASVTPRRRIAVPLEWVDEPIPMTVALVELIEESSRLLIASHEPSGWKGFADRQPIDHITRELAQAAAAGLMTGYRVGERESSRRRTLVLVPRPVLRVRRATGRFAWEARAALHAEHRPAVEWPDGTRVWYWDGVEIPTRIAERRDSLTPAQIAAIPNQEVRRLVLERVGWERFLQSARRVAQDDFGTLWDPGISLDGERLRVVEVINATQEPDGTHRRYLLRVPPTTRTAREGVAWTFGYENTDDYILAAAS
jgi:hypothetical protein